MKKLPYSENVLLTETEGNLKRTDELVTNSQQTLDRVGLTNPLVKAQADILKDASKDFNDKYQVNVNLKGISLNATRKANTFEKYMIKITRKLDKDVQHFYDEDTEEYYTVFVKGRSANYEGHSTHVQIQNYKSISMNMALLPSLNLLKTEYDINIGLYSDSVKFSADSKTDLDEQSTLMEAARVLWCKIGYNVIGKLMGIFQDTPEKVGKFFDLTIFDTRHTHIDPDKGATVIPLAIGKLEVFNEVYDSSKTFQVHNCGFGNVQGGSLPAANTLIIPNPLTWLPDETKIVTGAQMGDIMNRFLGFISDDIVLPGEIRIKEVTV